MSCLHEEDTSHLNYMNHLERKIYTYMYTKVKKLNKLKQEATHVHVQYIVAGFNSWITSKI